MLTHGIFRKSNRSPPFQASQLAASAAAKSQLAAMLNNGNLREIFGSEIAGIPTETVLAITQAQVWGGGAIF